MCMCKDCGLLAVREKNSTNHLAADNHFRQEGKCVEGLLDATGPICFGMAFDLPIPEGGDRKSLEIIKIISEERTCPRFTRWRFGFTPKEHIEMLYRDELEERRRQEDERRTLEAQAFQSRLAKIEHQTLWRVGLVGLFGAIVGAAISAAPGLIQAYWPPPDRKPINNPNPPTKSVHTPIPRADPE